jgi:hypothetical protein
LRKLRRCHGAGKEREKVSAIGDHGHSPGDILARFQPGT